MIGYWDTARNQILHALARDTLQNFTPAAGRLSVTYGAGGRDNGKAKNGRRPRLGCRPRWKRQNLTYGASCQTVPLSYFHSKWLCHRDCLGHPAPTDPCSEIPHSRRKRL